jgi:enoyl-CoA hydratase/carnithine racemase
VERLIEAIARSSSYTVALGKHAFYEQIDRAEYDAYEHTKGVMTENALAADAQEGMSAFLAKRSPNWVGH